MVLQKQTNNSNINQNSLLQLEGYIPVHQIRKSHKGGRIALFIHDSLLYKLHTDLSINYEDIESLSIEILNSQTRNTIFNHVYKPSDGNLHVCKTFLKKILSESAAVSKTFFLAGDFNINLLNFETNKKIQSSVNLMLESSMIPTINKPTSVTKHTATDNIITNYFLTSDFKSAMVKTNLYNHLSVIFINEFKRDHTPTDDMEKSVYNRDFNENSDNCLNRHYLKHLGITLKN